MGSLKCWVLAGAMSAVTPLSFALPSFTAYGWCGVGLGSPLEATCSETRVDDQYRPVSPVGDHTWISAPLSRGEAWYDLRAGYGNLGAWARAMTNGGFVRYSDGSYRLDAASAAASAEVSFRDFITVTSDVLPVGTVVTLTYSGLLQGVVRTNWNSPLLAHSDARLRSSFFLYGSSAEGAGSYLHEYCFGFADNCNDVVNTTLVVSEEFSVHYDVRIGDTIGLYASLYTDAISGSGANEYGGGRSEGMSDAFNSSHSFLDVVSPDVRLVSESGHHYARPAASEIAEPGTALLLMLGLGGLFWKNVRRDRSSMSMQRRVKGDATAS